MSEGQPTPSPSPQEPAQSQRPPNEIRSLQPRLPMKPAQPGQPPTEPEPPAVRYSIGRRFYF